MFSRAVQTDLTHTLCWPTRGVESFAFDRPNMNTTVGRTPHFTKHPLGAHRCGCTLFMYVLLGACRFCAQPFGAHPAFFEIGRDPLQNLVDLLVGAGGGEFQSQAKQN